MTLAPGLDALVQAMTCTEMVGWRDGVRRVIIFVTDAEPHMALDGILVSNSVTRFGEKVKVFGNFFRVYLGDCNFLTNLFNLLWQIFIVVNGPKIEK